MSALHFFTSSFSRKTVKTDYGINNELVASASNRVRLGSGQLGEEQIKNTLKDFGLTEKEAQIYIFLAKHGVLKGSEVSKYTKTNKAETYRILRNLQTKGLIEPTLQSPARYATVSFEKIIDLHIKSKQEEVARIEKARHELINYWSALSTTKIEPLTQKFVVIEGKQRINSKISEMIAEAKNHFSVISSVKGLMQAYSLGLFDEAISRASKRSIKFRFLTELSQDNLGSIKKLLLEMNAAKLEFQGRTPELGLRLFPRIIIRDDEEIVLFISSNTSDVVQDTACIWTNSKAIAQAFMMLFEDLWNNSIEIELKIPQIETGQVNSKPQIIDDPKAALEKYREILNSVRKEIIIMLPSEGLISLYREMPLLKNWARIGASVKIMAPITNENLKAAQKLSKFCDVKHVFFSYLITAIVDGTYLFQAKTDEKKDFQLSGAFYTDNSETVKRTQIMLRNIWEMASPPTTETVKKFINPPSSATTSPDMVNMFLKKMKTTLPKNLPRGFADSGVAFIHPPAQLNLPTIAIRIFAYKKESSFGEGNNMDVRLLLQDSNGYALVQVAAANTNPKAVIPERALMTGSPASENYQLVRPEELKVCRQGNTLFGGWTFPIPLPPTGRSLPPAALLIEGYGQPRHTRILWQTPSGYRLISEYDAQDAFVTFIDPLWKYTGPGSQGQIYLNSKMTVIPP